MYSVLFIAFTLIHSFLSYANGTCKELECIKIQDAKNVVYTTRVSIIHVTTATVKGTGNVCCSFQFVFSLYNRELLSVATLCLLKDSCHSLNNKSACHYTQVASPRLNEERKTNDEKYFVIIIQQITIHFLQHKNSAQRIQINGKLILIFSENTGLNHSFSATKGVRKCLGENQIKCHKRFANSQSQKSK